MSKVDEVEVVGCLTYQKATFVSQVGSTKDREELKQLMMNNGLVKIDVALVPKVID